VQAELDSQYPICELPFFIPQQVKTPVEGIPVTSNPAEVTSLDVIILKAPMFKVLVEITLVRADPSP
jgi:hypothetical protein